jgi:hypothetical protein
VSQRYGVLHKTESGVRVVRSPASREAWGGERYYYPASLEVRVPDGTLEGRRVLSVGGRMTRVLLAYAVSLADALEREFGGSLRNADRSEVNAFRAGFLQSHPLPTKEN